MLNKTKLLKTITFIISFIFVCSISANDTLGKYTEAGFLKEILGKSEDVVIEILGEPIKIVTKNNMKFFLYESLVQQGDADKYFKYTQLAIVNGIVQNIGNSNRAAK